MWSLVAKLVLYFTKYILFLQNIILEKKKKVIFLPFAEHVPSLVQETLRLFIVANLTLNSPQVKTEKTTKMLLNLCVNVPKCGQSKALSLYLVKTFLFSK